MIFDTDILIWVQRGNSSAAKLIDSSEERFISTQSYMELFQGAKNKQQHNFIRNFLSDYSFQILPLTENIGHRASIYIEEYSLGFGIGVGDAIIAATAIEGNHILCTANEKHFRPISDLKLKILKP